MLINVQEPVASIICSQHPTAVKKFFDAMEPLLCILSAIDQIILPHHTNQMGKVRWRLLSEVDLGPVERFLLPAFCLPFPVIQLLSQIVLVQRPHSNTKHRGLIGWCMHISGISNQAWWSCPAALIMVFAYQELSLP